MNKIFIMISVALAAVFSAGCSDEADRDFVSWSGDEGDITLSYVVDGDMPLSRGMIANEHETALKTVHILFFDKSKGEELAGYCSLNVGTGKKKISFDAPESLSPDNAYSVLAVGNADMYREDEDISFATLIEKHINDHSDYNDIVGELCAFSEQAITNKDLEALPLWGRYIDSDNNDADFIFTMEGNKQTVAAGTSFFFSRAVCRLDLHNLVGQQLKIVCARVVNGRTAGNYFTDGLNAGDQPSLTPQEAPSGKGYVPVTTDMIEGESTTQRIQASLYAFPNTLSASVVNDKKTTALMIAGYWYDNESGQYDNILTYYRFNIANAGEAQTLMRNYCYVATIKGAKRRGADNESDAYNDSSPVFIYDVDEEWDTTGDNVVSDEDGNFLIVNKTHLTFTGDMKENDFVELRVSTNPELTWSVEWDDQAGNKNEYFNFSKISDAAVKCGPKEENHTNYVRYAYLHIVARNPISGKELRMHIYLMQLSTSYNVKTLSVNGNTGTFTQKLSPYGGSLSLLVVTGGKGNQWVASDANTFVNAWGEGCSFTRSGDNNTYLTINYPANTVADYKTGELQTLKGTITVSLVENDTDEHGVKQVKDVVINLEQEPSNQLLDIVGMPTGVLELDCLDMNPGNYHGVVNAKGFMVRLTDPEHYRYRINSTFDYYRDLCISLDVDRTDISDNPAHSTHDYQEVITVDEDYMYEFGLYDIENGRTFYINPFRMGPGDPPIHGTITVTAYNIYDEKARTESRSFAVTLKAHDVYMGDVAIDARINGQQKLLIMADRNVAATPRYKEGVEEEQVALNYDNRDYVIVTNSYQQPHQNTGFIGIQQYKDYQSPYYEDSYFENRWKADNQYMRPQVIYDFYQAAVWLKPNHDQMPFLHNRIRYSKDRFFVVGDYKHEGKEVCCWLPRNSDQYYCEWYNEGYYISYWAPYIENNNAATFEDTYDYVNTGSGARYNAEVRLVTEVDESRKQEVLDAYGYSK